ncbi:acyltransferase [Thaumasiovibrio subtropicus]|uniref:acyltransferase n=1 Tax=Thaumasiovibrio subtropicus TaxID=1891207 RepID=UPI000B34AB3D|nr:acyltransferase [Thaumasiovibrio subtropicus]
MPCIYENISLLDEDAATPTFKREYQDFLPMGAASSMVGKPHLGFTLVRDTENYALDVQRQCINAEDFFQHITIGENSVLYSENNAGFENRPVRLTVCKSNDRPAGRITIGNNVLLQGTAIVCYQAVTIEDEVAFGPQVTIMDCSGHPVRGRGEPNEAARTYASPVTIKQGAWIGLGATILKGVTIGKNAVVSANSVVYEDVPDNAIVIGNPARVVKVLEEKNVCTNNTVAANAA